MLDFVSELFRFLSGEPAELYIKRNLGTIDTNRLCTDAEYTRVLFYRNWAFERAGASKRYRVLAMKCAASGSWGDAAEEYLGHEDKMNMKNNPLYEKDGSGYTRKKAPPDIRQIARDIKEISEKSGMIPRKFFEEQFAKLAACEISHKIQSLFLRDMFVLFGVDKDLASRVHEENILYLFPVDIWVRQLLTALGPLPFRNDEFGEVEPLRGLSRAYHKLAQDAIRYCSEENVSPLKLNMGVWSYCSNYLQSPMRLAALCSKKDIEGFRKEFDLLKDYV